MEQILGGLVLPTLLLDLPSKYEEENLVHCNVIGPLNIKAQLPAAGKTELAASKFDPQILF